MFDSRQGEEKCLSSKVSRQSLGRNQPPTDAEGSIHGGRADGA
jgi:hypothetical protein